MEIVLNYCQYGVLYLGSYYNTEPYIHFPHFGNSNLGELPNNSQNQDGIAYLNQASHHIDIHSCFYSIQASSSLG